MRPGYGYIGLGQMGSAMTQRLLSTGASVCVYDLDPTPVAAAVALGAVAAGSAAEVAARSEVVSVCVPAEAHVDAVLEGPGGIAEAARSRLTPDSQVVLLHSTLAPATLRRVRSAATAWNGVVHDACIAGGADAARCGELVILVGGLDDLPDAARDLLKICGSKVIGAGPPGAGAAAKLAVNVMTYAQFAAAAAAFRLARGCGVATSAVIDSWRHTGQLGRLTESFLGLLSIPSDRISGDLRASLEATAAIAGKDLALASAAMPAPGPPGAAGLNDVLRALHTAMPDVFGLQADSHIQGSNTQNSNTRNSNTQNSNTQDSP